MLELLYTSPRKVSESWNAAKGITRFAFNKSWDTMILDGTVMGGYGTFKIFKDGHAIKFVDSSFSASFPFVTMAGGKLCTYKDRSTYPILYGLFELDPFTGQPVTNPFFTFNAQQAISNGWFIDVERSLMLYCSGGPHPLYCYSLAATPVLLWTLDIGNTYSAISWVSDGRIMISENAWGTATGTKVIFVDYLERVVTLRSRLNTYRVATFDSRCGVVMAINTSGYTEIYYPQAVPNYLTPPVLNPQVVTLYGGNAVTTQVLGDLNEPCADRVVHWYLENGIGGLEKEATKTDINGFARNFYFSPDNPISIGAVETIRVEALI